MNFVDWKEKYSLNNKRIDSQHKKFFKIINDFQQLTNSDHSDESIEKAKKAIFEYANLHFDDEIEYFRSLKIDNNLIEKHIESHESLIVKYKELLEVDFESKKAFDNSFLLFIVMWLRKHILKDDKEMLNQLK